MKMLGCFWRSSFRRFPVAATVILGIMCLGMTACKKSSPSTAPTATGPSNTSATEAPATPDNAEVVAAIAANPRIVTQKRGDNIEVLDLSGLTPEEAKDLEEEFGWTSALPKLKTLKASGPGINDAAVAKLAGHPTLADLLFEERSEVTNEGVKILAALPSLTEVSLKRSAITDDAFQYLGQSKTLRRIRAPNTKISSVGVNHLANATQLQVLDLSDCFGISDACAETIQKLTKLRFLRLWGSSITDKMAQSISGLKELNNLTLQATRVSDEGIKQLEGLSELKDLSLYQTPVTDACLPSLGKLTKLQKLRLRETGMRGEANVEALALLTDLRELDLSESPIQDPLLASVAKLVKLESLDLWNTEVSAEAFGQLGGLKQLVELNLEGTGVGDAGLELIGGFEKLRTLNLAGTQVTDEGMPKLYPLKQLKALNLSHTQVNSKAFKALKAEMSWIEKLEY